MRVWINKPIRKIEFPKEIMLRKERKVQRFTIFFRHDRITIYLTKDDKDELIKILNMEE